MSSVREQLKATASEELAVIVKQSEAAIAEVVGDKPIDPHDVCRLIANKRTQSIRNACVRGLVQAKEQELIALYNDQLSLPVDDETRG